jgi:hypothetical protein
MEILEERKSVTAVSVITTLASDTLTVLLHVQLMFRLSYLRNLSLPRYRYPLGCRMSCSARLYLFHVSYLQSSHFRRSYYDICGRRISDVSNAETASTMMSRFRR